MVVQLIAAGNTSDAIISFAAVRPGNGDFANYVQDQMTGSEIRRYEVKNDIVPHMPSDLKFWNLLDDAFGKDMGEFDNWS